ncbi:hypothetical protein QR680_018132 [Steinernema hermaphroditum]|uniref:G-protein coupled receptors family 1 profile domain-containing protein n=1 Tax=Steinernema hermaphroditum TaxID=289476 RepID=A0AA39LQB7_9BILA|nr:hypothetical protein QR680_018132 [Steinernema hermaphroditum]
MESLPMIGWFAFTYLSLLLYVVVLVSIVRHRNDKHLNSSFFVISLSLGVSEVLSTIFIHFFQIWPKFGFLLDAFYLKLVKGYFALMCDQWNWALINVQSYTIFLATVNRTTSIVFPSVYVKIFNRKNTIAMCLSIWIITALIFSPIAFLTVSRYVDNRGNPDGNITQAMCSMESKTVQFVYVFFISFVQLVVSVVGLVLYGSVITVILAQKFRAQRNRRILVPVEVRLSMTIFFQVVLYAANCIVVYLGYFIYPDKHHIFIEISYITGDVTAMSTPYFLLFFSSRLRRALVEGLARQPKPSVVRTPAIRFSQSRSSHFVSATVKLTEA